MIQASVFVSEYSMNSPPGPSRSKTGSDDSSSFLAGGSTHDLLLDYAQAMTLNLTVAVTVTMTFVAPCAPSATT